MDSDAAERAAAAKWVEWAEATAARVKTYGDILVDAGLPIQLAVRLVEEYHRAIVADYFKTTFAVEQHMGGGR